MNKSSDWSDPRINFVFGDSDNWSNPISFVFVSQTQIEKERLSCTMVFCQRFGYTFVYPITWTTRLLSRDPIGSILRRSNEFLRMRETISNLECGRASWKKGPTICAQSSHYLCSQVTTSQRSSTAYFAGTQNISHHKRIM